MSSSVDEYRCRCDLRRHSSFTNTRWIPCLDCWYISVATRIALSIPFIHICWACLVPDLLLLTVTSFLVEKDNRTEIKKLYFMRALLMGGAVFRQFMLYYCSMLKSPTWIVLLSAPFCKLRGYTATLVNAAMARTNTAIRHWYQSTETATMYTDGC